MQSPTSSTGRPFAPRTPRPDWPRALLSLGGLLTIGAAILIPVVPPDVALIADNGQQIGTTALVVVALTLAYRSSHDERRTIVRGFAVSIALAATGLTLWYAVTGGSTGSPGVANVLLIAAVAVLFGTSTRAIFRGIARNRLEIVLLDPAILLVSVSVFVWAAWSGMLGANDQLDQISVAFVCVVVLAAWPCAVLFALLNRHIQPGMYGPYAMLAGLSLVGVSWVTWLTLFSHDAGWRVVPTDFALSVGILVVGYAGVSWSLPTTDSPRFLAFVDRIQMFPLLAVASCAALELASAGSREIKLIQAGTTAVVLLSLVRQVMLTRGEHEARIAERDISARLGREIRDRNFVLRSLSRIEASGSVDPLANRICDELLGLEGIDDVVIRLFHRREYAVVAGVTGIGNMPGNRGKRLSPERTAQLIANALEGPWVERFAPTEDEHLGRLYEAGLRISVNAPMVWNEQIVGAIGLGTKREDIPVAELTERLITARELGLVTGALVGPALAEELRLERARDRVSRVIEEKAFHPVFQPIIELETRQVVGFEALTRFDDGERPDLWFEDAASVGLGVELERATLQAALRASEALPEGAYLSLNASPDLVVAMLPLVSLLDGIRREVVIEITEHARVESYPELVSALQALRSWTRIAVDDAGAGYSSLNHLLSLRPDIAKLDIGLVRSIDTDPARRALISSMVAFACETRTTLLAEGVETEAEYRALRELGVKFGQGYLFGRPDELAEPSLRSIELPESRADAA